MRNQIDPAYVVKQVIRIVRLGDEESGDVQIRPAVVVVVAPRRRRRVLVEKQSGLPWSRRRSACHRRCGRARSVRSWRRTDRGSRRRRSPPPPAPTPPNSSDAPRRLDAPLTGDVDEMAAVVPKQAVGVAVLVGDEQIEIAVAVDVEPDGADGLARIADARLDGDVGEAAAVVAKQPVRLVAERDEEIEIAVVVVVDPRRLARDAARREAERRRHVREMASVAVVAIELVGDAADEADVQIDVAVAVEVAPRRGARFDRCRPGRRPPRRRRTVRGPADRGGSGGRGSRRTRRGRRRCRSRPTRWAGRRWRRTAPAGRARIAATDRQRPAP